MMPPESRSTPSIARQEPETGGIKARGQRPAGPTGDHRRALLNFGLRSLDHCWVAALAVIAGLVFFYNLGADRTFTSHEAYAAVPAQEMLNTGEWIVPHFGGVPRLKKPPLMYWTIAASARLFGELSEWTARLPSAVSGLLLTVLIGVWAGRWYGRAAGWGAAVVQATSVYVLIYARKAEVEMMLCLLTTAALLLVAEHRPSDSRRRALLLWSGVYALLSLAWLAKFHYGPTMVLGPTVLYFLLQRRFRSLWNLLNPFGLTLLAAAVIIWPYLVLQQAPQAWAIWHTETVGRATGYFGHQPFWFYVPQILGFALPWTPIILTAAPQSWRRAWRQGDPRERFLWVWFLTVFAVVTLSAEKHKHYILAAMPVLSLWAGPKLAALAATARRGEPLTSLGGALAAAAVCAGTGVGAWLILVHQWPDLWAPVAGINLLLIIGGPLAVFLLHRNHARTAAGIVTCLFVGCVVLTFGWIVPGQDHRRQVAEFAREVRRELGDQRTVYVYRMGKDPIVFYLDCPVVRWDTPDDAEQVVSPSTLQSASGRLSVVATESVAKELDELGTARIVKRMPLRSPESRVQSLVPSHQLQTVPGQSVKAGNWLVLAELTPRSSSMTSSRRTAARNGNPAR